MMSEPWACTDRLKKLLAMPAAALVATKDLRPSRLEVGFGEVVEGVLDAGDDFRSEVMAGITR